MENENFVSIVIPVYNEELGLNSVVRRIKDVMKAACSTYEIIVVDDGSVDRTAGVAAENDDLRLIQHPYNKGYGAALKTGIRHAKGNVILFIDGDTQHNPDDIKKLLEHINRYDMVVGARTKKSKVSRFKRPGKFVLGVLANYLAGRKIPDLNSGFRAVKKDFIMKYVNILPDSFSFTTTITLAGIKGGYNVHYVTIETGRRVGRSKIKPFSDGFNFIILILRTIVFFDPMKVFLPISLLLFIGGFILLLHDMIAYLSVPKSSLLLIGISIQVFLFGLLADQISLVRRYHE